MIRIGLLVIIGGIAVLGVVVMAVVLIIGGGKGKGGD